MAFAGGWWILSGPLFWLLVIVGIVLLVRAAVDVHHGRAAVGKPGSTYSSGASPKAN
jgi:hypothetical protein